jgi:hypothetical protein
MAEQYYKFIKSINIVDQLYASYMTCQKTKRWYLCLFYWYLDSTLINAYFYWQFWQTNIDLTFITTQFKFRNQIIHYFISYGVATLATLLNSSFPPQNRRFHSIDSLSKMHVLNRVHIPIKKAKG